MKCKSKKLGICTAPTCDHCDYYHKQQSKIYNKHRDKSL